MDKVAAIGIFILVLFYVLAATPADVGCTVSADAPVIARLWAATCDAQVAGGGR